MTFAEQVLRFRSIQRFRMSRCNSLILNVNFWTQNPQLQASKEAF